MTAKQAYEIIKEKKPGYKCIDCMDFLSFFGFVFVPTDVPVEEYFGGAYSTVDKETGKVSTFNPPDDFVLLKKGTQVDLSELD